MVPWCPCPPSTTTIDILPIALDLGPWADLLEQAYSEIDHGYGDDYSWTSASGVENNTSDSIPEVNMYPDLNSGDAPGNRGMTDLGAAGNSSADIKRQIVDGLNAYDLSFFPNSEITFDANGALYLNGDTGISAGVENALESIIGQVRAIPVFIEVTGQGNNATYTNRQVCRRTNHGRQAARWTESSTSDCATRSIFPFKRYQGAG
ncbi:MAG: hypothetical protein P8K08_25275 [Fuerstiella sp.]|jgi:hypothetical protein|nr:hypothetical protein [Fuerstiella sp.]